MRIYPATMRMRVSQRDGGLSAGKRGLFGEAFCSRSPCWRCHFVPPQGLGDRSVASKAHEPCSKPGLLYDARMREHEYEGNPSHPESPNRISRIWSLLMERGAVERCCLLKAREATKEEILQIHR
jgi:hypothetical protein